MRSLVRKLERLARDARRREGCHISYCYLHLLTSLCCAVVRPLD